MIFCTYDTIIYIFASEFTWDSVQKSYNSNYQNFEVVLDLHYIIILLYIMYEGIQLGDYRSNNNCKLVYRSEIH